MNFNFTSNSFTPDLFAFGAEYAYKERFMGTIVFASSDLLYKKVQQFDDALLLGDQAKENTRGT